MYIMGICSDVGGKDKEDEEDPFEQLKKKKMEQSRGNKSKSSMMDTIASLCIGDHSQSFSDIKKMNIVEIEHLIESIHKMMPKSKNTKNTNERDIEEISMPSMSKIKK